MARTVCAGSADLDWIARDGTRWTGQYGRRNSVPSSRRPLRSMLHPPGFFPSDCHHPVGPGWTRRLIAVHRPEAASKGATPGPLDELAGAAVLQAKCRICCESAWFGPVGEPEGAFSRRVLRLLGRSVAAPISRSSRPGRWPWVGAPQTLPGAPRDGLPGLVLPAAPPKCWLRSRRHAQVSRSWMTVRTTFPVFCPVSTYLLASATSSKG